MTKEELTRLEQSQLIKLIDTGKLTQVVRCGDCKLWDADGCICVYLEKHRHANDYCSRGEQRK